MTVIAVVEWQRFLEFTLEMTLRATDLGMLAEEWVLGLRMVKLELGKKFFPPGGGVTFLAALFKGTFVRIDMAVEAGLKFHVLVARWPAWLVRLMALLASHLEVLAGERVTRLRMIKLLCCFPIREIVTLQAVVSELAFVHIFVAQDAVLRQSKKGLRKILHLDERALIGNHISGHVTLLAGYASMLTFEHVPGELMVELFLRRLPVNQAEVFPVVIQMAPYAVFAIRICHPQPCMVAMIQGQPLRHLFVTIKTFERGCAGSKLVATRALRGSA
ncbi:MAG TPA: hypothetical protein VMR90_12795 [Candidatus Cybelea sp.]|nr:hypothetical protein [Candidatus Cybelea sp.]